MHRGLRSFRLLVAFFRLEVGTYQSMPERVSILSRIRFVARKLGASDACWGCLEDTNVDWSACGVCGLPVVGPRAQVQGIRI